MQVEQVSAEHLKVGDVVKVWGYGQDTITRIEPYTGPLPCLDGARIASMARFAGMTLPVGMVFERVRIGGAS